jgi:hypothetical protein
MIQEEKIKQLEKDKQRLLSFVQLASDFFNSDKSGHGQYLKSQADNALKEVLGKEKFEEIQKSYSIRY